MPGIWNINSVNDANAKRLFRKLSFEVGENILAKVVNLDKVTGEILLKLLDGWQFSAELEKPLETFPEGLLRFEVEGFQDGKLKLKIIDKNNKQEAPEMDSISNFLKESNIDSNRDDYKLLGKMVKHEIPLTKENVSNVKTVTDFMNKIKSNDNETESFILKYAQSKNVDINSEKGNNIRNTLNSFFSELKNLTEDDVLTIMENNIDLTEDNIKSFNNVFKGSKSVYNSIKDIGKEIFEQLSMNNNENKQNENLSNKNYDKLKDEKINIVDKNLNEPKLNVSDKNNKIGSNIEDENLNEQKLNANDKNNEIVNNSKDENLSESKLNVNDKDNKTVNNVEDRNLNEVKLGNMGKDRKISKNIGEKIPNKTELNISDKDSKRVNNSEEKNLNKIKLNDNDKTLDKTQLNNDLQKEEVLGSTQKNIKINSLKNYNIDDIVKNIKDQINTKTEEMKTIIKTILDKKFDENSNIYNKVIETLDNGINDFKIYNMVSNQYYYLDLPINLDRHEYQCKLMIKDERKKGKKIDSNDVKIATSVTTEHMGTVDAYIKLNNLSMEIDIKCGKQWTKVLDIGKEKISEDISNMGYNVYIRVGEREKEMNIVNCREFFEDKNLGMIDTKA